MKQMMRMKITYRSHVLMTGTQRRSPVPEAVLCIILFKSLFPVLQVVSFEPLLLAMNFIIQMKF